MFSEIVGWVRQRVTGQGAQPGAAKPGPRESLEELVQRVRPYTMTSPERLACLGDAVDYVVANGISGSITECGVWRGGSMMLAALRLLELGSRDRQLWLFDTFEGMTPPTAEDADLDGHSATQLLRDSTKVDDPASLWCYSSLATVSANLGSTGYPPHLTRFVEGPVEETIPSQAPSEISVLRLDTDWYESTRHELEHLYPRLVSGGVLIVDDYGHWRGARKAVDEFIAANRLRLFLHRVDYTARCAVKP